MANEAKDKVISTIELLQLILLHLDMSTALTSAQLVNHNWHSLITQHSALQKALFFKPEVSRISPSVPFSKLAEEDKLMRIEEKRPHPLLSKLLPPLFPSSEFDSMTEEEEEEEEEEEGYGIFRERNPHYIYAKGIKALPVWEKPGFRDAFLRPDASWRRMFTHQPPLESLGLLITCTGMVGTSITQRIIGYVDGVPPLDDEEPTSKPPADLPPQRPATEAQAEAIIKAEAMIKMLPEPPVDSRFHNVKRGKEEKMADGIRMATFYNEVHSILDKSRCHILPSNYVLLELGKHLRKDMGPSGGDKESIFKDAAAESEILLRHYLSVSCIMDSDEIEETEWEANFSLKGYPKPRGSVMVRSIHPGRYYDSE